MTGERFDRPIERAARLARIDAERFHSDRHACGRGDVAGSLEPLDNLGPLCFPRNVRLDDADE